MIFIDTGAFLARYLRRDQFHETATAYWQLLLDDERICYTSNFVLNETITLLSRRSTYQFARDRVRNLFDSDVLTILRTDENGELAALELLEK